MSFLQKKLAIVLIATIFSLSGGFFTHPQKAEAVFVPVGDIVNFEFHAFGQLKDISLDVIAWALAEEAKNALIADMINWVNSGFDGNPAFIQNPLRFAQSISDETTVAFISTADQFLSDAPFGDTVVNGLIYSYADNYFSQPYDLDNYSDDPEAFLAGDFSKGGWEAWVATTENPNNSFLGSYLEAKETQQATIQEAKGQEFSKAYWGDGFRSVEDASGNILTPGNLIQGQLEQMLGSGIRSLENADELSEVITALVGTFMNQVFSSTGLVGASKESGGDVLTELLRRANTKGSQEIGPIPELSETPTPGNNPVANPNNIPPVTGSDGPGLYCFTIEDSFHDNEFTETKCFIGESECLVEKSKFDAANTSNVLDITNCEKIK